MIPGKNTRCYPKLLAIERFSMRGAKFVDQNLGTKIWGSKFGDRNLGIEIWGPKFGDRNLGTEIWESIFGKLICFRKH